MAGNRKKAKKEAEEKEKGKECGSGKKMASKVIRRPAASKEGMSALAALSKQAFSRRA